MKLLEIIRQRLNECELIDFVKALGYHNIPKGQASLKKLTDCRDLSEWFASGHYDLVFNAEQFLEAVVNELGIDIINYRDEIAQSQSYYRENQNFRKCRLRIECKYKAHSSNMYMYYLFATKIPLDPKLIKYRKIIDILDSISDLVKEHYNSNNGEFSYFGKILEYRYLHYDNTEYYFDKAGTLTRISTYKEKNNTTLEKLFGVKE